MNFICYTNLRHENAPMCIPKYEFFWPAIAAISKGIGDSDDIYRTRFSGASDRVSLTA